AEYDRAPGATVRIAGMAYLQPSNVRQAPHRSPPSLATRSLVNNKRHPQCEPCSTASKALFPCFSLTKMGKKCFFDQIPHQNCRDFGQERPKFLENGGPGPFFTAKMCLKSSFSA